MLIGEDILRYYYDTKIHPSKLLFPKYFKESIRINLKGFYKSIFDDDILDYKFDIESLNLLDSNLIKYYEYAGDVDQYIIIYFKSEKDCILFKLKYGV